jgi:predicted short-subunit dehydrogenase-like oxidoreductase (DUF2520 family)
MNITIIGSGNVATVLGRRLFGAGHKIHQVLSRNMAHASDLADELASSAITSVSDLKPSAQLYLVAVTDDHLRNIGTWLKLQDQLVVHTAGSVSMEVLKQTSSNYGVLYPLQSVRKELNTIDIPLLIDANNDHNKSVLFNLAHSISDIVLSAGDDERSKLHLAAVITNNFTNHLFALTEEFCKKEGVEFAILYPLLFETVRRLKDDSPKNLQTGPAIRNDLRTIQKQRDMLNAYPQLQKLYDLFSQSIINDPRS